MVDRRIVVERKKSTIKDSPLMYAPPRSGHQGIDLTIISLLQNKICGGKKEDVGLDKLGEGGKGVVSKIREFGRDLGSELLGDRGGEEDKRRFIVI
ncbi:hypothetical protein Tco_1508559 [Tanacetum coccineum]